MRRIAILAVVLSLVGGAVAYASVNGTYQGYPVVKVVVNGTELQPDVPAIVMDGRTLLPVRAVAEALGARVGWQQDSYTVTVDTLLANAEMAQKVAEIVQPVEELMKQQVTAGMSGKEAAQKLQTEALMGVLRLRSLPLGQSDTGNTVREWALCYLWSGAAFASCVTNAFSALEERNLAKVDEQKALASQFAEAMKGFGQAYHNALKALQDSVPK